jgi:hypothetical protein
VAPTRQPGFSAVASSSRSASASKIRSCPSGSLQCFLVFAAGRGGHGGGNLAVPLDTEGLIVPVGLLRRPAAHLSDQVLAVWRPPVGVVLLDHLAEIGIPIKLPGLGQHSRLNHQSGLPVSSPRPAAALAQCSGRRREGRPGVASGGVPAIAERNQSQSLLETSFNGAPHSAVLP